MKVLILGSGAKDHAICWWFSQSRLLEGLYIAPGNPGTEGIATNLPSVDPSNPEQVYAACAEYGIDFVFVGTELPLFTGVIDYLNDRGISTFGAPSRALKLEGDRCYARSFTAKYGIPTPGFHLFSDVESLHGFLSKSKTRMYVVKSNKLSPSRVMVDTDNKDTIVDFARKILPSGEILLEDHVAGLPATVTVFVDNNGYLELPVASDYTKSDEDDSGEATGGMGSICPIPISASLRTTIEDTIISPTFEGMKKEGIAYKGVLTFSLVITPEAEPVLVDYHVRFNDPATQAMVPLIKTDIVTLLEAMKADTLSEKKLSTTNESAVAVVMASAGYPMKPVVGVEVPEIPPILKSNTFRSLPYFFVGALKEEDGKVVTSGGRCFTYVGVGPNIIEANMKAYACIDDIKFDGMWYRPDIGNKFFRFI